MRKIYQMIYWDKKGKSHQCEVVTESQDEAIRLTKLMPECDPKAKPIGGFRYAFELPLD